MNLEFALTNCPWHEASTVAPIGHHVDEAFGLLQDELLLG